MLGDFFRINMPYGLSRNKKNEWMAFNREYMPLGFNSIESKYKESMGSTPESENFPYENLPIHTAYKNMTNEILLSISDSTQIDAEGNICRIYLYNDSTNPVNVSNRKTQLFIDYFKKLEILSNLEAL